MLNIEIGWTLRSLNHKIYLSIIKATTLFSPVFILSYGWIKVDDRSFPLSVYKAVNKGYNL